MEKKYDVYVQMVDYRQKPNVGSVEPFRSVKKLTQSVLYWNRQDKIKGMLYEKVYLEKKNGGVSSARNYGLAIASGDWVLFLDGDDMLYPHALQTLIKNIESTSVEMLQFNFNRRYDATTIEGRLSECYTPDEYVRTNLCGVSACGSLIKFSIVQEHGLRFDESLKQGEDQLFILDAIRHCRVIQKTSAVLYYYRTNMASAVHNPKPEDIVTSIHKFIQYRKEFPFSINVIERALGDFIYKLAIFSNISPKELFNLYKISNISLLYQRQKGVVLMFILCKVNFYLGFYVTKAMNWLRFKISNILFSS